VDIPSDTYPPIEQGAVVLKSSPNKQLARQFLDFVKSKEVQDLLREYGFFVPSSSLQGK
jgi:molybdate transport system substrate-binding protein